ncbi:arylsulfotransferase family protein [Salinisphaera hydrothermalis]|uniref:arylsulfotransferase family protein n=1 Tax=Salinisphaera hydrothermalis TaxID=563188 RepID=UPI003342A181
MNKADRIGFAFFFVACLFIVFVGSAYLMLSQRFPYQYFDDAYKAFHAVVQQRAVTNRYTQTDQWRRARTDRHGVTIYDPTRADNGYTLYTSAGGSYAVLIDMHGHPVHRWALPYSKLWQKTPDGRDARADKLIYWTKAVMYPNGDLVAAYIAANDTPWGYGLVKLDAQSNVIWSYHAATHHDLDIVPDGRILALTNQFSDQRYPGYPNLTQPHLEDFLVVLDGQTGKPLHKVSLPKAFYDSRYRPLFTLIPSFEHEPQFRIEDPLHTNSVQYLGPRLARAFAPAHGHADQALLSFRTPGTVGLLDIQSGRFTWMTRGYWFGQHSPRALANGDLVLFDNYGHYQPGNASRILEIDPETLGIVWRYQGSKQQPLYSHIRSEIQQLPNGNKLVTESDGGRLFEVTPDKKIVWQFVNPVRGGDHDQYIPVIGSGHRYTADQLTSDFRRSLKSH